VALDLDWLDAWWADWLGASVGDLLSGGLVVTEHLDHVGVLELTRGHAAVVYGPARWLARVPLSTPEPLATALTAVTVGLFGDVRRVLGPAWYAYASADSLLPAPGHFVRRLGPEDSAAVEELRRRVSVAEWEESGLGGGVDVGWLEEGRLLAAASVGEWRGMPSVGVLTDPACRGRGLGRAAVAHAAQEALRSAPLVQYRAWVSNAASIALARELDFQTYAHAAVVDVDG